MFNTKLPGTFTSAGIFSAIAASLCCITPVIALLAGSSSIAANFSWIEPARPYLIGLSIVALALAWQQKLKKKEGDIDCNCETLKKTSFIQSKVFLGIVTVFAFIMMIFPLYAGVFYPKQKAASSIFANVDNKQSVKFIINGMTCEGCEAHVNNELSKVAGIITYKTSYPNRSALVGFDSSKTDVKKIENAINNTGYRVTGFTFLKPILQAKQN
jgi:copper chaperone CopZ